MKNLLLSILFAVVFGVVNVEGMSLSIQYCTENIDASTGAGNYSELAAAIYLPAEKLEQYKGKRISDIVVGMSAGCGEISLFKVFIAESLEDTPFYSQVVADGVIKGGWNSIRLDEPFEITGDGIFIGYEFEAAGSPIGISAMEYGLNSDANWVKMMNQWQQYNKPKGNNCIKVIVEGTDVKLNSVVVRESVKTDLPYVLKGTVVNNGGNVLNSFDVEYYFEGGDRFKCSFEGLDVKPGLSCEFVHETPFFVVEGNNKIFCDVSNINGGQIDVCLEDNSLFRYITGVSTNKYYKNILLEHFTTEVCQNCPGGHAYLEGVVGDNENVVWMAHHAGYMVDKFTIKENTEMVTFFKINSAPVCMLDRSKDGGDPVYTNMTLVTKAVIRDRSNVFSDAKVNLVGLYDDKTRKLDINVLCEFAGELQDPMLSVYLVENNIVTLNQSGATGQYTHAPVVRDALSATFGDHIKVDVGEAFAKAYSFTIPESWNADNVKVVAFVNRYSQNRIACEVYNVTECMINNLPDNMWFVGVDGSSDIEDDSGAKFDIIGGGYFEKDDAVYITAKDFIDELGNIYKFKNWSSGGVVVSSDSVYHFIMGAEDVSYIANYEVKLSGVSYVAGGMDVNISVFPNPCGDFVVIETGGYPVEKLEIYNVSGMRVDCGGEVWNGADSCRLNVENLREGVYFIRIYGEDDVVCVKFVKQ